LVAALSAHAFLCIEFGAAATNFKSKDVRVAMKPDSDAQSNVDAWLLASSAVPFIPPALPRGGARHGGQAGPDIRLR
jgi:hypothetical protein